MPVFYFVLMMVALPMLFLLFVWAIVAVHRICRPRISDGFVSDSMAMFGTIEEEEPEPVAVGFRDIQASQKRRVQHKPVVYRYIFGISEGVPQAWLEDLRKRRN